MANISSRLRTLDNPIGADLPVFATLLVYSAQFPFEKRDAVCQSLEQATEMNVSVPN